MWRRLGWCWRRPWLTALEVLWRWVYGVPVLVVVWHEASKILAATPLDYAALRQMTLLDPMQCSVTLGKAALALGPPLLRTGRWLGPLLVVVWLVVSSVGRTVVLRRMEAGLRPRPLTMMGLQAVRLLALGGMLAVWALCLRAAVSVAVTGPLARGEEPALVLYFALAIAATLGLFTLWGVVSWGFSVAPLLSMLQGTGAWRSLMAAFRLGSLRIKLVEINLVLGIVKIALLVLATVLSASPLPFEAVASAEFLRGWWAGVAVLYFVASDFFHVARLAAYLELWRGRKLPPKLAS